MSKAKSCITTADFVINKAYSKELDTCLARMIFEIEMDREVLPKEHYISPGGYIITCQNLEETFNQFDFLTTYGTVLTGIVDSHTIQFEVRDFDYEFSSPSEKFDLKYLDSWDFKEFFIYTGEADDPEINPVKINRLVFVDRVGYIYEAPEHVLASANRTLTNGH